MRRHVRVESLQRHEVPIAKPAQPSHLSKLLGFSNTSIVVFCLFIFCGGRACASAGSSRAVLFLAANSLVFALWLVPIISHTTDVLIQLASPLRQAKGEGKARRGKR